MPASPGLSRNGESLKKGIRGFVAAAVAPALALVVPVLSNSCSTVPRNESLVVGIAGASYVGNEACFYCHSNYSRTFTAAPHSRIRIRTGAKTGDTSCESCHGPGSKHVEGGGGLGKFIVNPGKDPGTCFRCHQETHTEFNLPHRHPVIEGYMNCVQCHDPHGLDIMNPSRGPKMGRLNESCAQCHREQTRPYVFEHEALREGCTVCHNPHGSINAGMLVERDNNLCLKCHAQQPGTFPGANSILIGGVDHTDKLRLGTCWSAGCHTAVHGSNFNPRQLY